MITRRTLLKLVGLLPFVGPAVAKALAKTPAVVPRVYSPYLPANFPKWNKAVDGLEDAFGWALYLERSWLPSGLTFPREGQVWEAISDVEIEFSPRVLKQPLMLESAHIKAGERVQVVHLDDPKPVFVSFVPMRGSMPMPEQQVSSGDPFGGCALQLKTVKTVGDLVQKEGHQLFFMQAFKLVTDN